MKSEYEDCKEELTLHDGDVNRLGAEILPNLSNKEIYNFAKGAIAAANQGKQLLAVAVAAIRHLGPIVLDIPDGAILAITLYSSGFKGTTTQMGVAIKGRDSAFYVVQRRSSKSDLCLICCRCPNQLPAFKR